MSTVFDFAGAAPEQTGEYVASAGAEVVGGVGRHATRVHWIDRSHPWRFPIGLSNPGAGVDRYVLTVRGETLPSSFRSLAQPDGGDVVVAAEDGGALDLLRNGPWDRPDASSSVLRLEALPSGESNVYLYAGSGVASASLEELEFFTDPTPTVRYFVTGSLTGGDVTFVSAVALNDFEVGGATEVLGQLEARSGASSAFEPFVRSAGMVAGVWAGPAGDAVVAEGFAGTVFVSPAPRFDEELFVVAPHGAATLTFTNPAGPAVVVPAGTAMQVAAAVADGSAVAFTSDVPVVAYRGTVFGDISPLPPASADILGVANGIAAVATGPAGAMITVTDSTGAASTVDIPAHSTTSIAGQIQGTGVALHIAADQPVGAMSYGDGDAAEAVAFLPFELLGRELVLPANAQYVAVASRSAVTCSLLDPAGMTIGVESAAPIGSEPGKLYFGSATNGVSVNGPAALRCDAPVYGAFEDAASDTETLLPPVMAHRPAAPAAISVTPGPAEESRFEPGASTIETPALGLPTPGESIESLVPTTSVEIGATLGWRISLDGGPWMIPSRGELVEATGVQSATAEAFAGIALDGALSIAVQAVLETDGLAEAVVEEINLVVLAEDAPGSTGDRSESSTGVETDTTAVTTDAPSDTTGAPSSSSTGGTSPTAVTTDAPGDTTSAEGSSSSVGGGTDTDSGAQGSDAPGCGCRSASPPWTAAWVLLIVALRPRRRDRPGCHVAARSVSRPQIRPRTPR